MTTTTTYEKPRTITRPPQGWEDFKIKALPGKIAGFAQEIEVKETENGILIPDSVNAMKMHLETPPYELTPVHVISSGVPGINKGDVVYAMPLDGQWWRHGELDGIPEGWQLRLYGVGDIRDQILCKA